MSPKLEKSETKLAVGMGQHRVALDNTSQSRPRLVGPSSVIQGSCQIRLCPGYHRIEFYRSLERCNRLVVSAQGRQQQDSAVLVGPQAIWIELERPSIGALGACPVPIIQREDERECIVGLGVVASNSSAFRVALLALG